MTTNTNDQDDECDGPLFSDKGEPVEGEEVYVESMGRSIVEDCLDSTGEFGVFGLESGYCYGTWSTEDAASTFAAKMNETL